MLAGKGCTTELKNQFEKTAKNLADAVLHEQLWSTVRPWNRGDLHRLGAKDVESHLAMQRREKVAGPCHLVGCCRL